MHLLFIILSQIDLNKGVILKYILNTGLFLENS